MNSNLNLYEQEKNETVKVYEIPPCKSQNLYCKSDYKIMRVTHFITEQMFIKVCPVRIQYNRIELPKLQKFRNCKLQVKMKKKETNCKIDQVNFYRYCLKNLPKVIL